MTHLKATPDSRILSTSPGCDLRSPPGLDYQWSQKNDEQKEEEGGEEEEGGRGGEEDEEDEGEAEGGVYSNFTRDIVLEPNEKWPYTCRVYFQPQT
ncbi:UNVERIFIED_CONTAM: hypothetical protein FKN15_075377 [Acipenser sinensis]